MPPSHFHVPSVERNDPHDRCNWLPLKHKTERSSVPCLHAKRVGRSDLIPCPNIIMPFNHSGGSALSPPSEAALVLDRRCPALVLHTAVRIRPPDARSGSTGYVVRAAVVRGAADRSGRCNRRLWRTSLGAAPLVLCRPGIFLGGFTVGRRVAVFFFFFFLFFFSIFRNLSHIDDPSPPRTSSPHALEPASVSATTTSAASRAAAAGVRVVGAPSGGARRLPSFRRGRLILLTTRNVKKKKSQKKRKKKARRLLETGERKKKNCPPTTTMITYEQAGASGLKGVISPPKADAPHRN